MERRRVVEELILAVDEAATNGEVEPSESGLYLHWKGRNQARVAVPKPRVLEEAPEHSDHTPVDPGNLVIEGDNRQAMVSLMGQWRGKVDVALLDVPYNTGDGDLRYSDKRFHDPDADDDDAVYVTNTDGGRHTKWLNQMAPTFRLVRDLMAPHGVLFVHINDIELPRLLMLLEDSFDEKNRIGTLVWKSATDNNPSRIITEHEYIVCWAKQIDSVPTPWVGPFGETRQWMLDQYAAIRAETDDPGVIQRRWKAFIGDRDSKKRITSGLLNYKYADATAPYRGGDLQFPGGDGPHHYELRHPVTHVVCKEPNGGYRHPWETMQTLLADDRILFGRDEKTIPQYKRYLDEAEGEPLRSVINAFGGKAVNADIRRLFPEQPDIFRRPKPVGLEEMLLSFVANRDAVVLDSFAGSGTTGHAVMRLNKQDAGTRRFILVEEGKEGDPYAATLTAERLRRARRDEDLPGGFTFLRVTRQIDAAGFATFQRHEVIAAIRQADASGRGTGIRPVDGEWVIGTNHRDEAICLHYPGPNGGMTTAEHLRAMFDEAYRLGLSTPLRVYGDACEVFEDDSFVFLQIPDELLRNLSIPGRRRER